MNIFFDLDGTLIDSKLRLYELFQFLVNDSNLTYDEYWELKQAKISNQAILINNFSYTEAEIREFISKWMNLIEHESFLKFDTAFAGVKDKLEILSKASTLYLCTARQFREPVLEQLRKFDLLVYFRDILITHQKYSKHQLIVENVLDVSKDDWFIGDTGYDIEVGKQLGVNTCAVTGGFLSRTVLEGYSPDLLVASVRDFCV